jgi:hypothetical protein
MSTRTKRNCTLLFLFCMIWHVRGQEIVEPENVQVTLAGEIKEVHGFGPPGYGEDKKTDLPIIYWVLELPTAINVFCKPERSEWASVDCKGTKQLRLFFPTSPSNNGFERKAKALKGHKATVVGILHRQDTMGEITPIYVNVKELQPLKLPQNR